MAVNTAKLKSSLRAFRNARKTMAALKKSIEEEQPHLVTFLRQVDPENQGFIYTSDDDEGKNAAYVQHNQAQEFWDTEAIIEWLKEDKSRWNKCSSRVFDLRKFEAEIANSNISPKLAKKFKKTGDRPAPFVRFGKPGENTAK